MQLKTWLKHAKGALQGLSDTASLDAELIACFCLNKTRAYLFSYPEQELAAATLTLLNETLKRRAQGEPIAYITGEQEFYSLAFEVNQHVLIPRADSELLVELSLNFIKNLDSPRVLDLGTGSGALTIAIAKNAPKAQVIGVDKSSKALDISNKNKALHGVSNAAFLLSDWFTALKRERFDLIVANPPYIAEDDPHLAPNTKAYEPRSALISGNNGLSCLKRIISQSPNHLTKGGMLIVEHGFRQAEEVGQLFSTFHYKSISYHQDLAEKPRAISGTT